MSCKEAGGSKVDRTPGENEVEGSMPGVLSFLFFLCVPFFFNSFVRHRICDLTTEYLDLIDCTYATELYAAVRRTSMYLYIPPCISAAAGLCSAVAAGAAPCCCCSSSCARLRKLLLWFIASDSSVSFSSSFKHVFVLMYVPLGGTVAFAASIYLYHASYILGNYGHARSQGGRQPAAAKPPCTMLK